MPYHRIKSILDRNQYPISWQGCNYGRVSDASNVHETARKLVIIQEIYNPVYCSASFTLFSQIWLNFCKTTPLPQRKCLVLCQRGAKCTGSVVILSTSQFLLAKRFQFSILDIITFYEAPVTLFIVHTDTEITSMQ